MERLVKVGRLGLSELKRDAKFFGVWLREYSPSLEISGNPTIYAVVKKTLGFAPSKHHGGENRIRASDCMEKKVKRGLSRFLGALLNETDSLYPQLPGDLVPMKELSIDLACSVAIALFWANLNLAKKHPGAYRELHGQKPPRNSFEEYVNMVGRQFVRQINGLIAKHRQELLDKALSRMMDESIEREATAMN